MGDGILATKGTKGTKGVQLAIARSKARAGYNWRQPVQRRAVCRGDAPVLALRCKKGVYNALCYLLLFVANARYNSAVGALRIEVSVVKRQPQEIEA